MTNQPIVSRRRSASAAARITPLLAAAIFGLAGTPTAALTINLIDAGGVTGSKAERGFRAAAHYWESVLTNDATVNFEVGFTDLGEGVLGGTFANLYVVDTAGYQGALYFTGDSALDAAAVANLPPLDAFGGVQARVPGFLDPVALTGADLTTSRLTGGDGAPISTRIALTSANLRAFGVDLGSDIDANITFSSTFGFDFNPGNGIGFNNFDFVGVAIHEMGHALGFLNAADDFDYFAPVSAGETIDNAWWAYASDMFRYSAPGELDWTPVTETYFSIDSGDTAFLGNSYSTGAIAGDGWQASHWKSPNTCGTFQGIMNPYVCNGTNAVVRALDLGLLDAIGWNTNVDVLANTQYAFSTNRISVPEPATWTTLVAGFALTGAAVRRRRVAV